MIFPLALKSYFNRRKSQHKRCLELEQQRNIWIRRAVAMAGPDDIAQWARDGAGPWDINFSGRKS